MANIPQWIIDKTYSQVDTGYLPTHLLAMEVRKNHFEVAAFLLIPEGATQGTINTLFSINVTKEEPLPLKEGHFSRFTRKLKKIFVGEDLLQQVAVDVPDDTVTYNLSIAPLKDLLVSLSGSHVPAVELVSYADISSQLWMNGPYIEDFGFAEFYSRAHAYLMEAASNGVNWVVVESEYLDKAQQAATDLNLKLYVEYVLRSRYVKFCNSVCFDLNFAVQYAPEDIQSSLSKIITGQNWDVTVAEIAAVQVWCDRTVEFGPREQTLTTDQVMKSYDEIQLAYKQIPVNK